MVMSQSDKVTLTKYPALPSLCRVCNFSADGNREFVDFQLSFDVDGAINICEFCMVNIVEALGFVSPEKNDLNKETISTLTAQVNELSENNERLNATLDALIGLRPDLVSDSVLPDEVASEQSDSDTGQLELAFEGDSDSTESGEGRESETGSGNDESESERGSENVSESTSKSKSSRKT